MTPFQRLETLVNFCLSDAVPEESVRMQWYTNLGRCWRDTCHTSGCRAGWGTQCPALQRDGFTLKKRSGNLMLGPHLTDHISADFLKFFGLTRLESSSFFRTNLLGTKDELRAIWATYLAAHPEHILLQTP